MKKHTVVFFVATDYDNLGVGYMASVLSQEGFDTKVIDFRKRKSNILNTLKTLDPQIIGFSIIFLNRIDRFIELIDYFVKGGINCHFTAGGHYASLRYEELFKLIPRLDSIVRFEGEYTLLELVKSIHSNTDWKKIDGLIYQENGKILTNPLRAIENDLDKFPFPYRSPLREYAFKKKFTSILAGRGCRNNCSFCNTREFYVRASGPVKRIRKPEMVVIEMEYLFREKGCSVFIFNDDDFPLKTKLETQWLMKFCNELEQKDLNRKIMWKINCRPDEVDEDSFSLMKNNGLFLVFLGIEDGSDFGLKRLNKHMTVAKSLAGINILKKLKIGFDYGFMLFQPLTTYKSLNENLDFLRQICSDGYTPVTFLRILPLYGTRVEKELIKAGRLKCSQGIMDYDFLEESMNRYYDFIMDCFTEWLRYPEGVENISKWARNYFSVYLHYYDNTSDVRKYYNKIRRVFSESNIFLLDTMKELALVFESGQYKNDTIRLESHREKIKLKHEYYKKEIINTMALLISHYEDQKTDNPKCESESAFM